MSQVALLFFDLSDINSLDKLQSIKDKVVAIIGEDKPIGLIGSKKDKCRVVSEEEARKRVKGC